MSSAYDSYIRSEWESFFKDDVRWQAALNETSNINVKRLLDVGCGAGQQLIPFAVDRKAFGVGVDISDECGKAGRELNSKFFPAARLAFVRTDAAYLPFESESFDLVICRIALPYMNNDKALTEMARVLKPDGMMILKIHHWRFYLDDIRQSVQRLNPLQGIHALRVFVVGIVYHLTGHQMNNRITGTETFQSRWLLLKKLKRLGLTVAGEAFGSEAIAPAFVIRKTGAR